MSWLRARAVWSTSSIKRLLALLLLLSLAPAHAAVKVERITYPVDGLRIVAHVFTPPGHRVWPGVVYAHDGVSGLSKDSIERCQELANAGYVVIAPSYRGEDGSDGQVEVAAGEVDDVLAAAKLLGSMSDVDPHRLAAIGTSHGALIVMLAAARSNVFRGVVEGYGVMDIHAWWHYLKSHGMPTDDPLSRRVYGNGPAERPQAFNSRSVVRVAGHIKIPVLAIQGDVDKTVPPEQVDLLAEAMKKVGGNVEVLKYHDEHGFLIYPGDAASNRNREDAWRHIRAFLARCL
ncbi:MAG: alpha/beta hydrolase family protein [Candidatus Xenobia bacterium]